MTRPDDLDRRLAAWGDDPFPPPTPRYLPQVLDATRHTRQRRPRILERWNPMAISLHPPLLAPPVRRVAIGLALLALLSAAGLVVGSLLRGPGPIVVRPAVDAVQVKNGLVAYGRDGDIWVAEPTATGEAHVLIGGPETDDYPDWSPDGTRIAWWRIVSGGSLLMAADADGSDVRQVTPQPAVNDQGYAWSPDGTTFLVMSTLDRMPSVWAISSDGTGQPRRVEADFPLSSATWRPDGSGFIVRGAQNGLTGLYPVSWPDMVVGDPIIESDPDSPFYQVDRGVDDLQYPAFSADGSRLVVTQGIDNGDGSSGIFGGVDTRNFVLDADGTDFRMVEFDPTSDYEDGPWISPDGTRLLMTVRKGDDHQVAIIPLDESTPSVATKPAYDSGALPASWSPDGTAILSIRINDGFANLIDPETGEQTQLPWQGGWFDWQPLFE